MTTALTVVEPMSMPMAMVVTGAEASASGWSRSAVMASLVTSALL